MRFKYTPEHLDFLKIHYLAMKIEDLTRAFNAYFKTKKTETAIRSALKNHRIKCGRAHKDRLVNRFRLFTPEQVQFLRDNYPGRSVRELKDRFNAEFGTRMTRRQIRTAVRNRKITSGRSGQFEKGHKPWNTGKKGYMGPNRTSFKPGSVPANRKPLGTERICSKDGYVHVKVAETNPHTGFPTRYKPKHVHEWEQKYGPVPDGHVLMFKDGDKLNTDPGNLMPVSRPELLRLNQHGYTNAPAELKPSILALAKLEVGMFEAKKEINRGSDINL